MPYSQSEYRKLKEKYGGYASWAIWNTLDPRDTHIIGNNIQLLNSNFVMVGLNISAPLAHPWSNFHIGRNDKKLVYAFNEGRFRGAYMTDFVKGEVEANSANIKKRIRNGSLDIDRHVHSFIDEMNDIAANSTSLFILFGGLVSELFVQFLAKNYPRFVSCQHYAVYGSSESWASETLERLAKY